MFLKHDFTILTKIVFFKTRFQRECYGVCNNECVIINTFRDTYANALRAI